MFDREEFLRKHGLVEVAASDLNIAASPDYADEGSPAVVDAPDTTEIAQKTGSNKNLIVAAAAAFANARRRLHGQEPYILSDAGNATRGPSGAAVYPASGPQVAGNPTQSGSVEIINVRPQSMADRGQDSTGAGDPGAKGIVVDKDRGIIGMQG